MKTLFPRFTAGKFLQAPAFINLPSTQSVLAALVRIIAVPEAEENRSPFEFEMFDEAIDQVAAIGVGNRVSTTAMDHDPWR